VSLMPNLEDIRVFLTAATAGGFSAAAEKLNTSPAYVSKRIAVLERLLDASLFLRSARKVTLTLEGKIAVEWSERLLDTMDQMSVAIHQEQGMPKGRLRIVTSTGFGSTCISRGELPQHTIAKRLASNYRVLCASPSYIQQHGRPKVIDDLKRHQCIGIRERDKSAGSWRLQNADKIKTIKLPVGLMTNNGFVAKHWCLQGHGIMLRSAWNIREELKTGTLVHVLPEFKQPANIDAIYTARLETSAKMRVCVNYFERHLPKMVEVMV